MAVEIRKQSKKNKADNAKTAQAARNLRGPAHKFERLFAMGEEKMKALDGYFLENLSADKVAVIIQREWGLFDDVSTSSLSRQLGRYKSQVWDLKAAATQEELVRDLPKLETTLEGLTARVDVLQKLENIVLIQEKRIMMLYEKEKTMPKGLVLGALSAEWKQYIAMLKTLGEFQMDMGVVRRAPKFIGTINGAAEGGTGSDLMPPEPEELGVLSRVALMLGGPTTIEGESSRVESGS